MSGLGDPASSGCFGSPAWHTVPHGTGAVDIEKCVDNGRKTSPAVSRDGRFRIRVAIEAQRRCTPDAWRPQRARSASPHHQPTKWLVDSQGEQNLIAKESVFEVSRGDGPSEAEHPVAQIDRDTVVDVPDAAEADLPGVLGHVLVDNR